MKLSSPFHLRSTQSIAELLENGTMELLILLRHSHNVRHPEDLSNQKIVEHYMRERTLKHNLSDAMHHILISKRELIANKAKSSNSDSALVDEDHESVDDQLRIMFMKLLEDLRALIDRQYRVGYNNNFLNNSSSSCEIFSRACTVKLLPFLDSSLFDAQKNKKNFYQMGGPYVILDLLQTHYIFHHKDCSSNHCRKFCNYLMRTLKTLFELNSKYYVSTEGYSSLLIRSPFYISMFINLIRNNQTNLLFLRCCSELLYAALFLASNFCSIELKRQLILCLTETAMNITQHKTSSFLFKVSGYILHASQSAQLARVFYQIDGAVEYVLKMFVDLFTLETGDCLTQPSPLNENRVRVLLLILAITESLLEHHPDVRDLFWNANIAEITVNLLRFAAAPPMVHGCDINFSLLRNFYNILKHSERERIKVRQMNALKILEDFPYIFIRHDRPDEFFRRLAGGRFESLKNNVFKLFEEQ